MRMLPPDASTPPVELQAVLATTRTPGKRKAGAMGVVTTTPVQEKKIRLENETNAFADRTNTRHGAAAGGACTGAAE